MVCAVLTRLDCLLLLDKRDVGAVRHGIFNFIVNDLLRSFEALLFLELVLMAWFRGLDLIQGGSSLVVDTGASEVDSLEEEIYVPEGFKVDNDVDKCPQ